MRTFKLTLAYDGTDFAGWQRQPERTTLQGTLEEVLSRITGAAVTVAASGRTDAGVHAIGQVVSFESQTLLEPAVLQRALNAELPDEMLVLELSEAPSGFHARYDAIGKRYRYCIHDGPLRNLFGRRYAWHCRDRLDVSAMHEAAQALLGTHDFRSFETSWPNRETSVRTITDILVARGAGQGDGPFGDAGDTIQVEVAADGFLYNMVRAIVGTLVEVGRGARPREWVSEVLAAQDRKAAGKTAPPQGLFLLHVDYPPAKTDASSAPQT